MWKQEDLDPEKYAGSLDAALQVVYDFERYAEASTPGSAASALVSLSNSMSDLRSWMPGYDWRTDTMPWDREEDD